MISTKNNIDDFINGKVIVKANKKGSKRGFIIFEARLNFAKLRQAFNIAPILHYFDLKYPIEIENNVLGYIISGILRQLTSNNLGQWHLVVLFSQKMISVEPR